ncbi:MAG: 3-hydroxyacyl-ACP dehydratase FabZ [Deltaproteobacteria bacterium]|nr:3-hydroxyacyl-ACP dehydratase FabZ [Candidatus Anaeroferrophillus wilburensis]MBN2889751.1 3-hydroxyacyl-ACP dehydratase FabZ [Deltaproteobacteria bacterium]
MIDIVKIMSYLPHRYPFLLIDRVLEMVPDKTITALKNVTINEPFFVGHFPGNPVMPGVLIVEAMAQAGGLLALYSEGIELGSDTDAKVYFLGIDKARFRKPVTPGDSLRLEIRILQHRGKIWKIHGEAKVGETLMAEAEMIASIA